MAKVIMSGIRKEFGSTVALSDFTLEIESGELVCLLGPSGCGKTTLLRAIAGFHAQDAGDIMVGGESISSLSANKRQVGMVFRAIANKPPSLDELGLPQALKTIALQKRGLVVLVGATGAGKSTGVPSAGIGTGSGSTGPSGAGNGGATTAERTSRAGGVATCIASGGFSSARIIAA